MGNPTIQKVCFAVLMVGLIIWRAWETHRRQGSVRGKISMSWSIYALVVCTGVVFVGTLVEFCFVPRRHYLVVSILGVGLFFVAHILRLRAIRTLDRFWSLHVEIRDTQELVQDGVYGYIRHPAYAAFILEHVAVPLAANAWYSVGAALFLYVPMLLLRMHIEEAALVAKFGDKYRDYQRRVGALLPRFSALAGLWGSRQPSS
ncbi:MAG TPA: isoprenylcysteine carboxylmethyltransferase family protein [Verrucomicrobiae bacterium]|nr:isoprenylcysteine carboxylmethyltransferase family protein [Verrucomicrobiae bacterium]